MTHQRNLEIAVLNQISQAVLREKNVSALLRQVLGILYREMGLLRGTVTLRRGSQLIIEASHGLSDAEMRRGKYRLGEGITGQVALTGRARRGAHYSLKPLRRTAQRPPCGFGSPVFRPFAKISCSSGFSRVDPEQTDKTPSSCRVAC